MSQRGGAAGPRLVGPVSSRRRRRVVAECGMPRLGGPRAVDSTLRGLFSGFALLPLLLLVRAQDRPGGDGRVEWLILSKPVVFPLTQQHLPARSVADAPSSVALPSTWQGIYKCERHVHYGTAQCTHSLNPDMSVSYREQRRAGQATVGMWMFKQKNQQVVTTHKLPPHAWYLGRQGASEMDPHHNEALAAIAAGDQMPLRVWPSGTRKWFMTSHGGSRMHDATWSASWRVLGASHQLAQDAAASRRTAESSLPGPRALASPVRSVQSSQRLLTALDRLPAASVSCSVGGTRSMDASVSTSASGASWQGMIWPRCLEALQAERVGVVHIVAQAGLFAETHEAEHKGKGKHTGTAAAVPLQQLFEAYIAPSSRLFRPRDSESRTGMAAPHKSTSTRVLRVLASAADDLCSRPDNTVNTVVEAAAGESDAVARAAGRTLSLWTCVPTKCDLCVRNAASRASERETPSRRESSATVRQTIEELESMPFPGGPDDSWWHQQSSEEGADAMEDTSGRGAEHKPLEDADDDDDDDGTRIPSSMAGASHNDRHCRSCLSRMALAQRLLRETVDLGVAVSVGHVLVGELDDAFSVLAAVKEVVRRDLNEARKQLHGEDLQWLQPSSVILRSFTELTQSVAALAPPAVRDLFEAIVTQLRMHVIDSPLHDAPVLTPHDRRDIHGILTMKLSVLGGAYAQLVPLHHRNTLALVYECTTDLLCRHEMPSDGHSSDAAPTPAVTAPACDLASLLCNAHSQVRGDPQEAWLEWMKQSWMELVPPTQPDLGRWQAKTNQACMHSIMARAADAESATGADALSVNSSGAPITLGRFQSVDAKLLLLEQLDQTMGGAMRGQFLLVYHDFASVRTLLSTWWDLLPHANLLKSSHTRPMEQAAQRLEPAHLHVGIVSAFVRRTHSVGRLLMRLVHALASPVDTAEAAVLERQIDVTVFDTTEGAVSANPDAVREWFDVWASDPNIHLSTVSIGDTSLTRAAKQIGGASLDALLFSDVYMNQRSTLLASMRLAPKQVLFWGHPSPSGMRHSVDYFVTADAHEPDAEGGEREGRQSYFDAQLVRFPHFSTLLPPPAVQVCSSRSQELFAHAQSSVAGSAVSGNISRLATCEARGFMDVMAAQLIAHATDMGVPLCAVPGACEVVHVAPPPSPPFSDPLRSTSFVGAATAKARQFAGDVGDSIACHYIALPHLRRQDMHRLLAPGMPLDLTASLSSFEGIRAVLNHAMTAPPREPTDWHFYICLQSMMKFHPDFDAVLAELVVRDPLAIVLMSRNERQVEWQFNMEQRIARQVKIVEGKRMHPDVRVGSRTSGASPPLARPSSPLAPGKRVLTVPPLAYDTYMRLVCGVGSALEAGAPAERTVVLDPFPFGGGVTLADAVACATPFVTAAGDLMHVHRLGTGIAHELELEEHLVADSVDEYVDRAHRVASDPRVYQQVQEAMEDRRHRIFATGPADDEACEDDDRADLLWRAWRSFLSAGAGRETGGG